MTDPARTIHVVFDLDDTLYAERDYAIGGFVAAAEVLRTEHDIPLNATRMTALLDQGYLGVLFKMALAEVKPDYTGNDLAALRAAYNNHNPAINLFPDAAAALEDIGSRYTLGLITDGHAPTQARKITALGISHRFQHIILTGALGPDRAFHKPHSRSYELMETALGAQGNHFVYVGDNRSKDFVAANARGWTTVEVDRPHAREFRIHKNQIAPAGGAAHHVVATLTDLPPVLAAL